MEDSKLRIIDSLKITNIRKINSELKNIKGNVICSGVGGSSVVSEFATKVLNQKNKCLTVNKEIRDLFYEDISNYDNLFICSYSGKNNGIKRIMNIKKNKYLLCSRKTNITDEILLRFETSIKREKSFIAISDTLIPIAILLNYYKGDNTIEIINEVFSDIDKYEIGEDETYEVMTGYDTSVASKFLESTFIEANLGKIIIHDKYSYCHGRSTFTYHNDNVLIYLVNQKKELDDILLKEISKYYKQVIIFNSSYQDIVIDNFNLLIKCISLVKIISNIKKIDLAKIKYSPVVRSLYHFKGEM